MGLLTAPVISTALAQDQAPVRKALRVCQDPNNMPFSNTKGEGYENKIAELFGKSMGLPIEPYFMPQRMNFVRNSLRYKLPGSDYPCDIMLGVPVGFDQVSVTKPYYRSTYVLVLPQGNGFESVKTEQDFLALPSDKLHSLKIGVYDREPGSLWLVRHKLVDQGVPYHTLNADADWYPGQIIDKELAQGKIDVAIVWGPIAAYYAKKSSSPLKLIPLKSQKDVPLNFEVAMGVRYGEKEWKDQVEKLIETNKPQITAILKNYGIPLVDANGDLVQ
jgi:quinoprotein dehydrogenase-associated probable ABC transporter substrate-binding protein